MAEKLRPQRSKQLSSCNTSIAISKNPGPMHTLPQLLRFRLRSRQQQSFLASSCFYC
jgi:hypothetical protein